MTVSVMWEPEGPTPRVGKFKIDFGAKEREVGRGVRNQGGEIEVEDLGKWAMTKIEKLSWLEERGVVEGGMTISGVTKRWT